MGSPCRRYANKWAPVGACVPAVTGTKPPTAAPTEVCLIEDGGKNWSILGLKLVCSAGFVTRSINQTAMTKIMPPKSRTILYIGSKPLQRCKKKSLTPPSHVSTPPTNLHFPPPPRVCFHSYHAASERSSLTFDVVQNWISGMMLCPSPSPCVSHAVTNWEACQRLGCVNGRLLVKPVCDLCFLFFFLSCLTRAVSLVVY